MGHSAAPSSTRIGCSRGRKRSPPRSRSWCVPGTADVWSGLPPCSVWSSSGGGAASQCCNPGRMGNRSVLRSCRGGGGPRCRSSSGERSASRGMRASSGSGPCRKARRRPRPPCRLRAEVWIPILTVCGDPVAAYVLRISGHNIFALKTGYDQTYSKYAPGLLLTSRVIRYGLEHGMEMLDLMASQARWKADWAREVRPHYELLLFAPTPTGRYAYWVRYGVRQQARKLPGAARLARWLRTR